jgi:hypothetical protein
MRFVQIVGLRIVQRIGQMLVLVVAQVGFAVTMEGDDQPEIGQHEPLVQPSPRCGVTVTDLVLDRGLQSDQINQQRDRYPRRQGAVIPGQQSKTAVTHQD